MPPPRSTAAATGTPPAAWMASPEAGRRASTIPPRTTATRRVLLSKTMVTRESMGAMTLAPPSSMTGMSPAESVQPRVSESPRVVGARICDAHHIVVDMHTLGFTARAEVVIVADQALVAYAVNWTAAAIADNSRMKGTSLLLRLLAGRLLCRVYRRLLLTALSRWLFFTRWPGESFSLETTSAP